MFAAIVGTALFWINIFGRHVDMPSSYSKAHQGWPWLISYDFSFQDFEKGWIKTPHSFYSSSMYVNLFFSVILLFSIYCTLNYLFQRWRNRSQFFLSELFILLTAGAVILSFLHYELRESPTPWRGYQPLHDLPWPIQIPLWFGIGCSALLIGGAVVHGPELLFRRRNSTKSLSEEIKERNGSREN